MNLMFKFDHQNVTLLMPSLSCEQLELVSVSIKLFREAGSPSGLAAGFEIWSSQVQILHLPLSGFVLGNPKFSSFTVLCKYNRQLVNLLLVGFYD